MILAGIRVLDISGTTGAACARFLASLGAEVVQGDVNRLKARCADFDILLDSAAPGYFSRLDMEYAALAAGNPGLIQVSITPFGQAGPFRDFSGSELVCSALGGVLWSVGDPDRAPVKEALDACTFHACGMAACAAMIALYERSSSGLGQHVDVSIQEVAASRCTNGVLLHQFDGRSLHRCGGAISYGSARVRCIWTLADGYAFHSLMTGKFGAPANAALSGWIDETGMDNPMRNVDWLRYDRSALDAGTRALWEDALNRFFRSRTKAEIATEGRRRGINATVVNEPSDVLADPHLHARAFFQNFPGLGANLPGRFLRICENDAADSGSSAAAPIARAAAQKSKNSSPLAGLKVLDFSWALVGSITTKQLADCGADVIKVESATRPCLSRIDVQVSVSKRGNFDDKPWFIHMNTSKRSLRLNAKHPRAREILDPLLDWADVVVENFSPGTMASLGLDYATLSRRRPDLIMLSGSVYGQTGPLAKEWGVDGTGAALSGRTFMTGWPDRAPVIPSAVPYGDVVQPPFMVAGLCAALHNRSRTGRGCHIDASMYEVCAQQMWDALAQAGQGASPGRTGNDSPGYLYQGVLPAAGNDCWIAISIPDAQAWTAIGREVGGPWPAPHEIPQARKNLDEKIAAWTIRFDRYELMVRLQKAGIPAGVVQSAADLLDRDAQLRGREFVKRLENSQLGPFEHQTVPYKFSRSRLQMRTAPALGEHSEEICRQTIGMPQEAYISLRDTNLFE